MAKRKQRFRIITRAEWGARAPKARTPIHTPTPELWIHHSAGAHPNKAHFEHHGKPSVRARLFKKSAATFVRGIQNFHMDGRGWNDIAYSFLVFRAWFGRYWVFEGRGIGVQGAHTEDHNSFSHAICLVGNYDVEKVGRGIVRTVRRLRTYLVDQGAVEGPASTKPTGGHQDAPPARTACPGRNAMARMSDFRKVTR